MNSERKVRGDAKLDRLKPAQRARLLEWLEEENRTYAEVVSLVQAEFRLTVGRSAVASYWRRHVLPRRYREEVAMTEELVAAPEGKFEEVTVREAKRLAWHALTEEEPQVQTAKALMAIVQTAAKLEIARGSLALQERHMVLREKEATAKREAETAEEKKKHPSPLTPEERERRLRQIFGLREPEPKPNPPLFPGSSGVVRDGTERKENEIKKAG